VSGRQVQAPTYRERLEVFKRGIARRWVRQLGGHMKRS
jgi:hypothetical protein